MINQKRKNLPLTLITALLLVMMALLTGSALLVLRQMHGKSIHTAATEMVISQGQRMAQKLAMQPAVLSTNTTADWSGFSRLVHSLHSIEGGLQYVSVSRGDLTLFHEQTCHLDGTLSPDDQADNQTELNAIQIRPEALHIGKKDIPVVVFTTSVKAGDGTPTQVQVALRKAAVTRKEHTAETAITSMFRLSLFTVLVSFAICVALVVWMMRREAEREQQRREEEHLAFSGMLANGIVHDFRNPMSSMRLDVQMLQREGQRPELRPEKISKLTERIRNTLDRMDKVFQEFLFVSRPDTSQPVKLEIGTCLRDTLDMLAPRLDKKHLKVRLELTDTPVKIKAYEGSLRRSITNILTNAIQFSPEGGEIRIKVEEHGARCLIDICDEGPGIPKERRHKVFEMFETTRPEGTGLGLFIAKAAIERVDGTIEILANHGGGTCVRISLPLRQE